MTLKKVGKYFAILALVGALFAGHAFAQAGKFQATITLIGIQPFVVQDFTINEETFYDAVRQGKNVKLHFRDLKEIRFLNPGRNFEAEVLFNDGRKEEYRLQPAADIIIDTGAISTFSHTKVARIQFAPMPAQTPPPGAQPALQKSRTDAQPMTSDRIVLWNGDSLSGQIQTNPFPLRTAYGNFRIEASQIVSIEFDPTRPTVATVLLKNGDRLSGTVEVETVRFTLLSGETASFEGKTIKNIHFKR